MSRRLAPLATLALTGTAAAAPSPPPAQGIALCDEGFEIQLAPVREGAMVVLIGANDYGLVTSRAC